MSSSLQASSNPLPNLIDADSSAKDITGNSGVTAVISNMGISIALLHN
jgi:hypothetical protein